LIVERLLGKVKEYFNTKLISLVILVNPYKNLSYGRSDMEDRVTQISGKILELGLTRLETVS
jgi:hypothetical protein